MIKPIEIILLPEAKEFVDEIEYSARKKCFIQLEKQRIGFLEIGLRK